MRIVAEMTTPSSVAALELDPPTDTASTDGLKIGESLQKIVRFDLKEEGNHVLAVSVSYTETKIGSDSQAASGRVRTFRKLYQFVAQPCLSVRTKASELPPLEVDNKSLGPYGKTRFLRYALEAQLENVGEGAVVVKVRIVPGPNQTGRNANRGWKANETQCQAPVSIKIAELGYHEFRYAAIADPEPPGRSTGGLLGGTRRRPERGPGDFAQGPPPRWPCHAGSTVNRMARRHGR